MKLATCVAPSCASDGTVMLLLGDWLTGLDADGTPVALTRGFFDCLLSGPMGSVHKSIDGSLFPVKIMFPLYHTSHFVLVNNFLHPALHRTLMTINDAIDNFGTTCPTNIFGSPEMYVLTLPLFCPVD